MTEAEDRLRAAFEADFAENPSRPGLRERALRRAMEGEEPRSRRSPWFSPARMAPGIAVLVIAAGGAAYLARQAPSPTRPRPVVTAPVAAQFGKLPAPALTLPQGVGAGNSPGQVYPYFGPANLSWVGTLPTLPTGAPVYRFPLSTAAIDAFVSSLHATAATPPKGPAGLDYALANGMRLSITLPDPQHGATEARYQVSGTRDLAGAPATDAAARADADQLLKSLGLLPTWPNQVLVVHSSAPGARAVVLPDQVVYQRQFAIPGGLGAGAVTAQGDPDGVQVAVDSHGPAGATGQLALLPEVASTYPLASPGTLVTQALASGPLDSLGPDGVPAAPAVRLTNVALVYIAVSTGDIGYYEPAFLFSGRFDSHGSTFEKRVLVPAVAGADLQ